MKKVTVTLVGIMLLLTILVTSRASLVAESGKTWYVPDNFSTIQAAMDSNNVKSGDTIYTKSGTYNGGFNANKSVIIIGENPETTIINLNGNDIVISTDKVTIKDLSINAGKIYAENVNGTIIIGNKIIGGNKHYTVIDLGHCNGGDIADNLIQDCDTGIAFVDCIGNSIEGNKINSVSHGMDICYSSSNTINGNNFTECYFGIELFYSNDNCFQSNIITGTADNKNLKGDGMDLTKSSHNIIGGKEALLKNVFSNFKVGMVYDDFSYSRIALRKNNIMKNNFINIFGPLIPLVLRALQNILYK
jgi:parallel beta-helix repeat protein